MSQRTFSSIPSYIPTQIPRNTNVNYNEVMSGIQENSNNIYEFNNNNNKLHIIPPGQDFKRRFVPCMSLSKEKDFMGLRDKRMVYCLNGIKAAPDAPSLWRSVSDHKKRLATLRDTSCHPGHSSLNPNQISVGKVARLLAMVGSENMNGHRGLVCFHATGSGKTLAALTIMLQYWRDIQRPIVLVTSISNRNSNSHSVYANNLIQFYGLDHPLVVRMVIMTSGSEDSRQLGTQFFQDVMKFQTSNSGLDAKDPKKRLDTINKLKQKYLEGVVKGMLHGRGTGGEPIKSKFSILSFKEAIDRIGAATKQYKVAKTGVDRLLKNPSGSVFIIDEAQGLFNGTDSGTGLVFLSILQGLSRNVKNRVHVYIMTATPATSINEWFHLLRVIGPSTYLKQTWDGLESNITNALRHLTTSNTNTKLHQERLQESMANLRGMVSFADFRTDVNQHACILHHQKNIEMPFWYFAALLMKSYTIGEGLPNMTLADVYSIILSSPSSQRKMLVKELREMTFAVQMNKQMFPTSLLALIEKHNIQTVQKKQPPFIITLSQTKTYLVHQKVRALAYRVNRLPGKQFVYVTSKTQADILSVIFNSMGITEYKGIHHAGQPTNSRFFMLRDNTTREARENLKKYFDDPSNKDGSRLKIILASGQNYEGVDFKHLRAIHTTDILPIQRARQLDGRGVRMCSHTDLPKSQRAVLIVKYITGFGVSKFTNLETLMKHIRPFLDSTKKGSQRIESTFKSLLSVLKDNSVDPITPDQYLQRFIDSEESIMLDHFERALISNSIECPAFRKNPNYQDAYRGTGTSCGNIHKVMPNGVVARPSGRECRKK